MFHSCSVFLQQSSFASLYWICEYFLSLFFPELLDETEVPKTTYITDTLALCKKPRGYDLIFFLVPSPSLFFSCKDKVLILATKEIYVYIKKNIF